MIYLLDTNVLLNYRNLFYPQEQFPYVWEWMLQKAIDGEVKIPKAVYDEFMKGNKDDFVRKWCEDHAACLMLEPNLTQTTLNQIFKEYTYEPKKGDYGVWLNEKEMDTFRADPFIIAQALSMKNSGENVVVVTAEDSAPAKNRTNRKIPDICDRLHIKWLHAHFFLRTLNFKYK